MQMQTDADKKIPHSESEPSAEGGFSLRQVNLKSVFWTKPADASWNCELKFALFYQTVNANDFSTGCYETLQLTHYKDLFKPGGLLLMISPDHSPAPEIMTANLRSFSDLID